MQIALWDFVYSDSFKSIHAGSRCQPAGSLEIRSASCAPNVPTVERVRGIFYLSVIFMSVEGGPRVLKKTVGC